MFFNADKEREEIRKEREALALEKAEHEKELEFSKEKFQLEQDKLRLQFTIDNQANTKVLTDQIADLKAQLKIEQSKNDQIRAQAKSEFAEHVMAVTDERVKEIRGMYEGYAKNLTEVVKAANTGEVSVNANVGNVGK